MPFGACHGVVEDVASDHESGFLRLLETLHGIVPAERERLGAARGKSPQRAQPAGQLPFETVARDLACNDAARESFGLRAVGRGQIGVDAAAVDLVAVVGIDDAAMRQRVVGLRFDLGGPGLFLVADGVSRRRAVATLLAGAPTGGVCRRLALFAVDVLPLYITI